MAGNGKLCILHSSGEHLFLQVVVTERVVLQLPLLCTDCMSCHRILVQTLDVWPVWWNSCSSLLRKSKRYRPYLGYLCPREGDENHAGLPVLGVCSLCTSVLVTVAAWSCWCARAELCFVPRCFPPFVPVMFPALLLTRLQLLVLFDLELQYPHLLLYCQGRLLPTHPL